MTIVSETLMKYDFYLKWRLNYNCNYDCPYCIQRRSKCKERHQADRNYDILGTANKIANLIRPNMLIELSGGEISLVKEVPEIVALFKSKGADVKCITNLSRNWEFYKDFTALRASFHPSNASVNEFIDKLTKLKSNGVEVSAEVVISPKSPEIDNEKKRVVQKWCEENNIEITVDFDRFEDKKLNSNPKSEGRKYMLYVDGKPVPKQEVLDEEGLLRTEGKKCYRGVNSIYVILDEVSICPNNPHNQLGWYEEPTICKYRLCGDIRCVPYILKD